MKSWLVLCALLSAAIVGVQIHKMRSAAWTYYVHPGGNLMRAGDICNWDSLGEFQSMRSKLQPGDEVELELVRSKLFLIKNLKCESLTVVRDKRPVAHFKLGQIEFYGIFALLAALPLLVWAIAFAFLSLTPRKNQE